jgi:hypothetical protein
MPKAVEGNSATEAAEFCVLLAYPNARKVNDRKLSKGSRNQSA